MNKAIKRYSAKASQMRRKQPQLRKLARLSGSIPAFSNGRWRSKSMPLNSFNTEWFPIPMMERIYRRTMIKKES